MINIEYDRLPSNYTPRAEELAVITKIFDAYMACNAVETFEYEVSPGYGQPATAMGLLAEAGRTAWRQLLGEGADQFWGFMIESGEDAQHQWNWYVKHHNL